MSLTIGDMIQPEAAPTATPQRRHPEWCVLHLLGEQYEKSRLGGNTLASLGAKSIPDALKTPTTRSDHTNRTRAANPWYCPHTEGVSALRALVAAGYVNQWYESAKAVHLCEITVSGRDRLSDFESGKLPQYVSLAKVVSSEEPPELFTALNQHKYSQAGGVLQVVAAQMAKYHASEAGLPTLYYRQIVSQASAKFRKTAEGRKTNLWYCPYPTTLALLPVLTQHGYLGQNGSGYYITEKGQKKLQELDVSYVPPAASPPPPAASGDEPKKPIRSPGIGMRLLTDIVVLLSLRERAMQGQKLVEKTMSGEELLALADQEVTLRGTGEPRSIRLKADFLVESIEKLQSSTTERAPATWKLPAFVPVLDPEEEQSVKEHGMRIYSPGKFGDRYCITNEGLYCLSTYERKMGSLALTVGESARSTSPYVAREEGRTDATGPKLRSGR